MQNPTLAKRLLRCGMYCFPKKKAMEIATTVVKEWKENNCEYSMQIVFSCVDYRIYQYACEYLSEEYKF